MAEGDRIDDRFERLQLIRSANVGPVTFRALINRFGDARTALEAIPQLAARAGGRAQRSADRGSVEREIEAVRKVGGKYVFLGFPGYPALLAELEGAPPALIVRGNSNLFEQRPVALVGARNASAAACRFARDLAYGLGQEQVVAVSGLARGIDTAAHQGAIESGTIAVIACGLDVTFPPENASLQQRIAEEGLLVTEYPPGTQPMARHFPARNRIIAGLSLGTVVVEAAPKSGSLITARLAAEAGREVMAVPGSPLDQRAQGCNGLIREGATLVQNAADILEALGPIDARMVRDSPADYAPFAPAEDATDADRQSLVDLLGPVAVNVDELVRQSGLAAAVVQTLLLELDLAGRIERHAGGRVSLA